jgi:DNA (cytosine-5)-methyltransferase 1
MDFHTIELFAGVGQLGEGLRAWLAYLGRAARPVAYVEREAYAASVLAARMQEGSLDAAPVWSDVTTFNAHQWAGAVDCVVAGFPCQDLSLAGRRAGLDGKRSGLFFEVVRIARDCGARYLFLENVAGIASATASVVDEAEGALDERAAARVLGELADNGWNAEWVTLSASDVGASHGRARWFCWAWRVGEPESIRRPARRAEHAWQQRRTAFAVPGGEVGHTGLQHQHLQQREDGAEHPGAGQQLADASNIHKRRDGRPIHSAEDKNTSHSRGDNRPFDCGAALVQPEGFGCPAWGTEHAGQQRRTAFAVPGGELGHTTGTRPQEPGQARERELPAQVATGLHHRSEQPDGSMGIFAPGPADPAWPGIIQQWPHLAPALEPSFHRVVDGLAHRMDDCRPQRLKCCGNGVVAAQAAFALVGLVRRMTEI